VKITTTITVEVERADGTYTKTTERRDHTCGDNPRLEAAECAQAINAATAYINRRIKSGMEERETKQ
jgi:hypothetical protein